MIDTHHVYYTYITALHVETSQALILKGLRSDLFQ